MPEDIDWLAMNIREVRDAIGASGIDHVPAHGDGNVSNLMFSRNGEVRLLDWDMAGDMDPMLDVGAFLVEAHDSESDAAECFEAFHGRFERALFNRAWLYGVADDLRWGLIGALLAGTSRRETYEFLKFGDWRFLRCPHGDPRSALLRKAGAAVMTEKTLGQGETAAEKSLEAAIASVPQWQGKAATYAPIVGGLMNGNFRVSVAGE